MFVSVFLSFPKLLVNVHGAHPTRVGHAAIIVRHIMDANPILQPVVVSSTPEKWEEEFEDVENCKVVAPAMKWLMCAADDPHYADQHITSYASLVIVDAMELFNMDVRYSAVARGLLRVCSMARHVVIVREARAAQDDIPVNILKALGASPPIFYIE
jgi:hypothetical protein